MKLNLNLLPIKIDDTFIIPENFYKNTSIKGLDEVKVNGTICDQVGNICMDLMMIDVTNVKDVKINDEVTIWNYNNDLKQIAQKSNKIVYEVISNIGNRVERIIEGE